MEVVTVLEPTFTENVVFFTIIRTRGVQSRLVGTMLGFRLSTELIVLCRQQAFHCISTTIGFEVIIRNVRSRHTTVSTHTCSQVTTLAGVEIDRATVFSIVLVIAAFFLLIIQQGGEVSIIATVGHIEALLTALFFVGTCVLFFSFAAFVGIEYTITATRVVYKCSRSFSTGTNIIFVLEFRVGTAAFHQLIHWRSATQIQTTSQVSTVCTG